MKKYNIALAKYISLVIFFSLAIGISSVYGYWTLVSILVLLEIGIVYYLVKFLKRVVKDTERLINAIRFTEFNILFKAFESKGLPTILKEEMGSAISSFNERMIQIRSEQDFHSILLNRVDIGLIVFDELQNIIWANKAASDILGKSGWQTLQDLNNIFPDLSSMLYSLSPLESKTIRIHNGNKEYRLLFTSVCLTIRGVEKRLLSFRDIQSALDDNEIEAWRKLTGVLTHEIMNSLTPIISLSETFAKPGTGEVLHNSDGNIHRAMQTIYRRSKGLVEFVHNYKQLTHIPLPNYSCIEIKGLMDDIENLLHPQGIVFTTSIIPDNFVIEGDRTQLEQVIINLVKNAWDASSGKRQPDIKIEVLKDEYLKTVIMISDNGCGIPTELLNKIFIPFFSTKKQGAGIGLSICRQIIKSHNGNLAVSSKPNEGSCFKITL